ncbi:MAG: hypothetical protein LBU03_01625 [Tannerellaceae bacterium]|jgi:hypothetical protein|nr:hypothetical protein [Tannerellaceae bacterium]
MNIFFLRKTTKVLIQALTIVWVCGCKSSPTDLASNYFVESDKAFANPGKGIRSGIHPYGTLERPCIGWNQIETKASDGAELLRHYADSVFEPWYRQGI